MTAGEIVKLLEARHAKDLCIPECKTGPTHHASGLQRMDLWVMPRSWAHPWCAAYEVKVSRSDFLSDQKWPGYLEYCNYFSFACPHGLIQPDEVPEGVGLMWAAKTGTRVFVKRKPHLRRDVRIPEDLWRYVLMARVHVSRLDCSASPADYWRAWLAQRDEDKWLGQAASRKVATLVAERITAVEIKNHELQRQIEALEALKVAADELGFNLGYFSAHRVKDKLAQRVAALGGADLARSARTLARELEGMAEQLEGVAE